MSCYDLFFQDPKAHDRNQGRYSTLYLLRRDISMCFGIDPSTETPIQYQVLFPGVMAILAGIDLLAKFYCGSDRINEVGKRFKSFVVEYIDSKYSEELYQLRNSLLHSFGLYTVARKNRKYNFILHQGYDALVITNDNLNYFVSVHLLRMQFELAVKRFRGDIDGSEELKRQFDSMYPRYGCIGLKQK